MKSSVLKNTLWGFLILLPIALYFYFLSAYSLNIPKWDDHALKAFILDFQNTKGFIPKIQTFFKQHNEHRIAFDRVFTLIVFWIHGSIEYRWLMWVGNFTLLGVLLIFYKIFQKQKHSIAFFIPIPFILFQLQLWENTFWGMAAMQNFGIIFFIFGLIYLISSPKRVYFYIALLFAFFVTYTSGNGITAFPICLVLLILQRRFKDSIIFGGVAILLVFLYFYHYQMPTNNPSTDGIGVGEIIFGFFSFLGSVFDLLPYSSGRIKFTIILGVILFIISSLIAIYLIFNSKLLFKQRNLNQPELFILGSFMFLIGTAIVVTYTRISYGGVGLLTSRYKIYSILLLITLYLAIISKLDLTQIKWAAFPLILGAIGFNILANYINFKEVVNFRNQLISFAINWKLDPIQPLTSKNIVLHELPKLTTDSHLSEIQKLVESLPIWKEKISKSKNSTDVFLQNFTFPTLSNKDTGIFIIVQSKTRTYLMPTQLMNYPLNVSLRIGKYWQNGFVSILNNNEFENGKYHLGIWIQEGIQSKSFYLNDSLIVNIAKPKSVKTNW
ncbi:MAG: hypothetical protein H7339_01730 [Arcicella sp.]|nr:hypothetical protein [Arcicella sp.]